MTRLLSRFLARPVPASARDEVRFAFECSGLVAALAAGDANGVRPTTVIRWVWDLVQ